MTRRNRWMAVALPAVLAAAAIVQQVAERAAAQQTVQAPRFEVDPFWPKPLPNNWVLGRAIGVGVDSQDHVWIVHRPDTLLPTENAADHTPPTISPVVSVVPRTGVLALS